MLLCFQHGLRSVENTQLLEDLIDVNLDGLFADIQIVSDDFVWMALCNQIKHFQLPLCESKLFRFGAFFGAHIARVHGEQWFEFENNELCCAVFG